MKDFMFIRGLKPVVCFLILSCWLCLTSLSGCALNQAQIDRKYQLTQQSEDATAQRLQAEQNLAKQKAESQKKFETWFSGLPKNKQNEILSLQEQIEEASNLRNAIAAGQGARFLFNLFRNW